MVRGKNPTPGGAFSVGELENRARALAEELGLDPVRVLGVAHRGLELTDRHGEPFPHLVLAQLQVALGALGHERALEFFERENLVKLVAYAPYPAHLADPETPFWTHAEFAELIRQFRSFQRLHQAAIVAQGQAPTPFAGSPWLERRLSRLYYLNTASPETSDDVVSGFTQGLDIWRLRDSLGERGHDRDTGQLKLDKADATRLIGGRPRMFDLKLDILLRLEEALRRATHDRLIDDCLDLMADSLTAEALGFYLRMDRFYRGEDAGKEGLWEGPTPVLLAVLPGGFSDLLELMGQCEFELEFRVMDQTKHEVLALADKLGKANWGEIMPSSYFELIDLPWRSEVEGILDRLMLRNVSAARSPYWREFRDHLRDAFENRWLWAPERWSQMRKEIERVWSRATRGVGAAAQELDVAGPDPAVSAQAHAPANANVFRQDGDGWFIRYRGIETRVWDLKGLHYLSWLLDHPNRDIDVVALIHLIEPPDRDVMGESCGTAGPEEMEALGIGGDALGSGGRPRRSGASPERFRMQYEQLQKELEDARELNDVERIADLEERQAVLLEKVKAARRSDGGGPRDKARRAVKKCIMTARQRIKAVHPALWEHLKASIKIGLTCCYQPLQATVWNQPSRVPPR